MISHKDIEKQIQNALTKEEAYEIAKTCTSQDEFIRRYFAEVMKRCPDVAKLWHGNRRD